MPEEGDDRTTPQPPPTPRGSSSHGSAPSRPSEPAEPDATPDDSRDRKEKRKAIHARRKADAEAWIGRTLGDCELLRVVDAGSLSMVFEAQHHKLDIRVAVKVFRKQPNATDKSLLRFYSEARQAARLDHPNVVRVFDVDTTDDCHYLVMQFVDGKTLTQILKSKGPMRPRDIVSVLGQALNGLAYAHNHNCIHRDVKPDNLMMTRDGILKITDFGLAREVGVTATGPKKQPGDTHRTQAGVLLGTPVYMPQEQWEDAGAIDQRADLYSLGITAYQLLSGALPYNGTNPVQILGQIIRGDRPRLRDIVPEGIDPTLERIIDRMMAPHRTDRYPRAEEVLSDLRNWHARQRGQSAPTTDDLDGGEPEPAARSGDTFAHYKLNEYHGRIGSAEQWFARNTGTYSPVLLKILRDPQAADRIADAEPFVRKLQSLHVRDGLLQVRDVLANHSPPLVVFDAPVGVPLPMLVKASTEDTGRGIGETQTINILISIANVLTSAHDRGMLHGHLDATQVLVDPIGDTDGKTVLLNLGLRADSVHHPLAVRLADPVLIHDREALESGEDVGQPLTPLEHSASGSSASGANSRPLVFPDDRAESGSSSDPARPSMGFADWIPPEVVEGADPSIRSDLYGIGLLGVYALTGKRPGRNLPKQLDAVAPSAGLRDLLLALTEEDPADRPPDAREVARQLVQIKLLSALGSQPPPPSDRMRAIEELHESVESGDPMAHDTSEDDGSLFGNHESSSMEDPIDFGIIDSLPFPDPPADPTGGPDDAPHGDGGRP